MNDYVHAAFKWVSNNRYSVLATVVAGASVFLASCSFKAKDPLSGAEVTKDELRANIESEASKNLSKYKLLEADYAAKLAELQANDAKLIAQYEAAVASIERQEQTWESVLSWVQSIPAVGANPYLGGALGLAGAVFGLGVGLDNKRKDKVIKDLKPKAVVKST